MVKNTFLTFFLLYINCNLFFGQINLPYNEVFGTSSTTMSQWDFTNPDVIVTGNPNVGSPNGGQGSVFYNFYNTQGYSVFNLVSPLLSSSGNANIRLTFDFAAANRYTMPAALQTVFADDHIIIEYSADGGQTFNQIHDYEIGQNGELNTGGTLPGFFTPNQSQWVTKSLLLPAGTNKVKFKGVKNIVYQAGNFAYLDNVKFEECDTTAPSGAQSQSFCSGQTLGQLALSGTGIQWYDAPTGGNLLSNNTQLVNGMTYYAAQTINLCESKLRLPVTTTLGGCLLGIKEENLVKDKNFIYPNPSSDRLYFKSDRIINTITIYSATGQKITEIIEKNINSVDVRFLPKGLYILCIKFENGETKFTKIVKE